MKSKSRLNWPERQYVTPSPNNQIDCFRLITREGIRIRSKDSITPELEPKQGELLADANYILCDNACKDQQKMNGEQIIFYFWNNFKTTFIPWVLARCTIIRL